MGVTVYPWLVTCTVPVFGPCSECTKRVSTSEVRPLTFVEERNGAHTLKVSTTGTSNCEVFILSGVRGMKLSSISVCLSCGLKDASKTDIPSGKNDGATPPSGYGTQFKSHFTYFVITISMESLNVNGDMLAKSQKSKSDCLRLISAQVRKAHDASGGVGKPDGFASILGHITMSKK